MSRTRERRDAESVHNAEQRPMPARDAYRLWAESYDAENAVTLLEDQAVRRLTPELSGAWLLDAACGTGRRLPLTDSNGPQCVVGVDIVFEMLHAGTTGRGEERKRGRTDLAHGSADLPPLLAAADMRRLPCPDSVFDVVWCRLAIGHVPDPERVYAELARVARAGGHVIVTDFHPAAARAGHSRTFRDAAGELRTIEHYIHDAEAQVRIAERAGLTRAGQIEPTAGPEVRGFYEAAGRLDAFEQHCTLPLVLALAFRA